MRKCLKASFTQNLDFLWKRKGFYKSILNQYALDAIFMIELEINIMHIAQGMKAETAYNRAQWWS
jgi:hypothetical protein